MSIFADVLSFICAPRPGAFEALALRVFRFQAVNVPPYRAYLKSLGVEPDAIEALEQIPPVSTLAFKYAALESVAEAPTPASRIFLTSGTTSGREQRGRHLVLRPAIYQRSALNHLRAMVFPDGMRTAMLALHPTADRLPESSLAQMISWCMAEFGAGQLCAATAEAVDIPSAMNFLCDCARRRQPVCVLSTTAALGRLFDALKKAAVPIQLAPGSRLMDTGGPKGQAAPLAAQAVIELAEQWLGIDREKVINEYGMTELCSQLYDATSFNSSRRDGPGARAKLGPPWLRPFTFDPATLQLLPRGARGLLGFFDLANAASVSMIVTEDLGVVDEAGGVQLEGRASSAGARGCALAIKEFAGLERCA